MNQPKEPAKAVSDEQIMGYANLYLAVIRNKHKTERERYLIKEAYFRGAKMMNRELLEAKKENIKLKEQLKEARKLLINAQSEIYLASEGNPELVEFIKSFLSRTTDKKGGEG